MSALARSLDRLWDVMGDRSSLFPELGDDAVMARARSGEVRSAMPRLLELALTGQLATVELTEVFDLLADRATWSAEEERAVEDTLDTWWTLIRTSISPEPRPGVALACLSRTSLPLVRWLSPWLDDLDGPSASHLAEVVISQLPESEWEGHEDQRSQILGWCRTEPVVIGLTVVGGIHLDDGQLSAALDLML